MQCLRGLLADESNRLYLTEPLASVMEIAPRELDHGLLGATDQILNAIARSEKIHWKLHSLHKVHTS